MQPPMELDKDTLIEEIRKRPVLWDFRNFYESRNNKRIDELWLEIAKMLGSEVASCKLSWQKLRTAFFNEMKRMPSRIAKAKRNGSYDVNKKYTNWPYFDAIKFIANGRSDRGMQKQCLQVFSDIKIVANDNSDKMQLQNEKTNENDSLPSDSQKTSKILFEDNSEQAIKNIISYSTMGSNTLESECNTNSNTKSCLAQVIPLNELVLVRKDKECEKEICNSYPLDAKDFSLLQANKSSTVSKPEQIVGGKVPIPFESPYEKDSAFLEENIEISVSSSDRDCNFLVTVLAQMKQMTHLQKLQFQAKMSNLVLEIFSSSAPVKDLDKRVLSNGDNDPDKAFLISFFPFLRCMSFSQKLIFRSKIVDLACRVLETGG